MVANVNIKKKKKNLKPINSTWKKLGKEEKTKFKQTEEKKQ